MAIPKDIDQKEHYTLLRSELVGKVRYAALHGCTAETAQLAAEDALIEIYPELEKNR